jgi:hypothetical protein
MPGRLNRFLGDAPLRVAVRLLLLSFLVGLVLSSLNIRPWQIYWWIERLFERLYVAGFDTLRNGLDYLLLGAVVVVPLFLLSRLLRAGGPSTRRLD